MGEKKSKGNLEKPRSPQTVRPETPSMKLSRSAARGSATNEFLLFDSLRAMENRPDCRPRMTQSYHFCLIWITRAAAAMVVVLVVVLVILTATPPRTLFEPPHIRHM